MQTSTNIRYAEQGNRYAEQGKANFAARQAQVAAIKAVIFSDGSAELHADSTALCSHFKLRKGWVGGEEAEAQLYSHTAGMAIRFWVYEGDFGVKCRDLVLLPSGDKGYELWLEVDGKLFPHEGKYALAGQQVVMNALNGR